MSLYQLVKHLPGKHPQKAHGHSEGYSQAVVDEALNFVKYATLSSRGTPKLADMSPQALALLAETVDPKKSYKLYRGIGIVRARVAKADIPVLNALEVGAEAPPQLFRQVSDIASYTKKKSVANSYSEGALSVILQAVDVNKINIIVDLERLPDVLTKHGIKHDFDETDYDYWKSDKEVFVKEPANAIVLSVKGRL